MSLPAPVSINHQWSLISAKRSGAKDSTDFSYISWFDCNFCYIKGCYCGLRSKLLIFKLFQTGVNDDFAEFDFDEGEDVTAKKDGVAPKGDDKSESPPAKIVDNDDDDEDNEAIVEDEESDFNHFEDEEEFEG